MVACPVVTTMQRRQFIKEVGAAALAGVLKSARSAAGTAHEKPIRKRIKIGQIGVGHAHASKLAVYRNSTDYEVVGIVEPDANLRQSAEKRDAFRDLPWMTKEKLLGIAGLQAVLVETRVDDLLQTAEACVA